MQKDFKFDIETLKRVQVFKERYSVFPLREPYSTWVRAIRRNAGLGEKIVEYWSDDKHQYHSLGDDNKMKFGLVLCDYFREIDLDRNLYHQEEIDDFSGYVKKIQENQSFNDLFFSGVFDRVADIIHQFGVGEHGNLPALRFCHKMLTYSELEQRVSSVAKSLSEIGIHKGCLNHIETPHKHNNPIIGIYMHRSLDSIIVKLAIWRIGGAFVPIDAYDYDGTDAAICYRLNDSGARWIITAKDLKERNLNRLLKVNDDGKRWLENIETNNCLCIEDLEKNRSESRFIVPVSRNAEDTAYIMYTSGSTGNPKGVAIPQAGIQSMMSGHCEAENGENNKLLNENDVMAQYQSDSWDASIAELSLLSIGGCVTVVPDELKGNAPLLRAYFIQHGITAAIFTPQEFDAMGAFHTFSMLRVVYIVGDTLTPAMLRKWHDAVIKDGSKPAIEYIVNGYGLTETTVAVSIAIIKWEDIDKLDKIPIGIPFKSAVCKINNDELLVGGPCLMLGYVGDNKEKNTVKIIEFNGERYYRTNDKVSERDGILYHDGRIPTPNANQNTNDIEIKIGSGMRVNPVDAERDLKKFVENSRVIIIESKCGYKRLHAFIELNEPLPNEKINITIARLRREYEDSYKRHSLDHKRNEIFQWHIVNRIPTCLELIQSRNGRIIVGGLLIDELKEKISVFGNKFYFTEVGESKKADITRPDTLVDGEKIKTAQNLIQLWSNLLNVDSSQIGIDDSYDELGVCSLIGTLFMCKLTEIFPGITINRKELRDADTIRKQVDYIHRLSKEDLVKLISKKDGNNKLFLAPSLLLNYRIDYEASFVDGLKSKLGEDWGIHGLDFIQDSDKVYDFDSLIDRYISAIRKKQSNGPYHIGGLSAGSITAWLIAIKLTQRGEDVILSIYDGFNKMDDEKQVEILTDLGLHLLKKGFNVANEETEEENRKQDREKIIKAIMCVPSREELTPQGKRLLLQDRAERVFSIVMEINKNRSGENIDKTEMHINNARLFFMALQSVTINPIDALVLGIQAKDSFAQVELDKHWPVVGNKLHKRVVSGDHFSFMRNPETPSSIGAFHQYHAEKLRLRELKNFKSNKLSSVESLDQDKYWSISNKKKIKDCKAVAIIPIYLREIEGENLIEKSGDIISNYFEFNRDDEINIGLYLEFTIIIDNIADPYVQRKLLSRLTQSLFCIADVYTNIDFVGCKWEEERLLKKMNLDQREKKSFIKTLISSVQIDISTEIRERLQKISNMEDFFNAIEADELSGIIPLRLSIEKLRRYFLNKNLDANPDIEDFLKYLSREYSRNSNVCMFIEPIYDHELARKLHGLLSQGIESKRLVFINPIFQQKVPVNANNYRSQLHMHMSEEEKNKGYTFVTYPKIIDLASSQFDITFYMKLPIAKYKQVFESKLQAYLEEENNDKTVNIGMISPLLLYLLTPYDNEDQKIFYEHDLPFFLKSTKNLPNILWLLSLTSQLFNDDDLKQAKYVSTLQRARKNNNLSNKFDEYLEPVILKQIRDENVNRWGVRLLAGSSQRLVFSNLSISRLQLVNSFFHNCSFIDCNFSAVAFDNSIFSSCEFDRCKFLDCSLSSSKFENCKFNRSDFCHSSFVLSEIIKSKLNNVTMHKSALDSLQISFSELTGSKFIYSDLSTLCLLNVTLKSVYLSHSATQPINKTVFSNSTCDDLTYLRVSSFSDICVVNVHAGVVKLLKPIPERNLPSEEVPRDVLAEYGRSSHFHANIAREYYGNKNYLAAVWHLSLMLEYDPTLEPKVRYQALMARAQCRYMHDKVISKQIAYDVSEALKIEDGIELWHNKGHQKIWEEQRLIDFVYNSLKKDESEYSEKIIKECFNIKIAPKLNMPFRESGIVDLKISVAEEYYSVVCENNRIHLRAILLNKFPEIRSFLDTLFIMTSGFNFTENSENGLRERCFQWLRMRLRGGVGFDSVWDEIVDDLIEYDEKKLEKNRDKLVLLGLDFLDLHSVIISWVKNLSEDNYFNNKDVEALKNEVREIAIRFEILKQSLLKNSINVARISEYTHNTNPQSPFAELLNSLREEYMPINLEQLEDPSVLSEIQVNALTIYEIKQLLKLELLHKMDEMIQRKLLIKLAEFEARFSKSNSGNYIPNIHYHNFVVSEEILHITKIVENISSLSFSYCEGLTDTYLKNLLLQCQNLKVLSISNCPNLKQVQCKNLTSIEIKCCSGLSNLSIIDCDCPTVSINQCENLKELVIKPDQLSNLVMESFPEKLKFKISPLDSAEETKKCTLYFIKQINKCLSTLKIKEAILLLDNALIYDGRIFQEFLDLIGNLDQLSPEYSKSIDVLKEDTPLTLAKRFECANVVKALNEMIVKNQSKEVFGESKYPPILKAPLNKTAGFAPKTPSKPAKKLKYFTAEYLEDKLSISVDANYWLNKEWRILMDLASLYNVLFYEELCRYNNYNIELDHTNQGLDEFNRQKEWAKRSSIDKAREIWAAIKDNPKSPSGPLTLAAISKAMLDGTDFDVFSDRYSFLLFAQHNDDFRKLYQWAIIDNVVEEGKRLSVIDLLCCLGTAAIVQSNEEAQRLTTVWFGDGKKDSNPIHTLNTKIRRASESDTYSFNSELLKYAPSLANLYLNDRSPKGSAKLLTFLNPEVIETITASSDKKLCPLHELLTDDQIVALLVQDIVQYFEYRDGRREKVVFNLRHLYNDNPVAKDFPFFERHNLVVSSGKKHFIYCSIILAKCEKIAYLLRNFLSYLIRYKRSDTLALIKRIANLVYLGDQDQDRFRELRYRLYHPITIRVMEPFWIENKDAFTCAIGERQEYLGHFLEYLSNKVESLRGIDIRNCALDTSLQEILESLKADYKKIVYIGDTAFLKFDLNEATLYSMCNLLINSSKSEEQDEILRWIESRRKSIQDTKLRPELIVYTLYELVRRGGDDEIISRLLKSFKLFRLFSKNPYAVPQRGFFSAFARGFSCEGWCLGTAAIYVNLMNGVHEFSEPQCQKVDELLENSDKELPLTPYLKTELFLTRAAAYKEARSKAKASPDNATKESVRYSSSQTATSQRLFTPVPVPVHEGVSNARPSADLSQASLRGQDFDGIIENNNNI